MRLEILLEPSGVEADNTLMECLETFCLSIRPDNLVEIDPDRCFEVLAALRGRCYDQGLTIDVKFHGKAD